jgi:hypothetical protein
MDAPLIGDSLLCLYHMPLNPTLEVPSVQRKIGPEIRGWISNLLSRGFLARISYLTSKSKVQQSSPSLDRALKVALMAVRS